MNTFKISLLLVCIFISGCKQETSTISKVEIVEQENNDEETNDEENPSASDSLKDLEFIREATYGSTDDVIVGIMGPFAVDENERVFMIDRGQTTVHVFKVQGSYLKSLGSQGRGPGEFMAVTPHTTITIHSDLLYITDLAEAHLQFPYRMHEFLLEDLTFSRTIDLLAENKAEFEELEGYYPKRRFPLDDGTFLVSYHRSANEYRDGESSIYYVVQDRTGAIISGPVLKQKDQTILTAEVTDTPLPYTAIHSFPFHGKSVLTVSGENNLYAVNHTEEFKIDIYTPQGEHVGKIEQSFANIPFNRNETLDYYEKTNYGHRLGEGVALRMIREAENLPETWPAIEDMLIDDENRLWISTIVDDFDVYEWWVLENSGDLITKFTWPRDEPIEVVRKGFMYTRETDEETGLQQVVRYRVDT
ncbi:MAG: 6-bladed beta-propeller [Balneolaceae bacterium]